MELHYVQPGKAWLRFASQWYLLDTRDGPLSDWEIGLALYHIQSDSPEDVLDTLDDEIGNDVARLILRTVWFDDTNGGITLNFDLLYDRTTDDRAQHLSEAVDTALGLRLAEVPWHGQFVTASVRLQKARFHSDHHNDQASEWWGIQS